MGGNCGNDRSQYNQRDWKYLWFYTVFICIINTCSKITHVSLYKHTQHALVMVKRFIIFTMCLFPAANSCDPNKLLTVLFVHHFTHFFLLQHISIFHNQLWVLLLFCGYHFTSWATITLYIYCLWILPFFKKWLNTSYCSTNFIAFDAIWSPPYFSLSCYLFTTEMRHCWAGVPF